MQGGGPRALNLGDPIDRSAAWNPSNVWMGLPNNSGSTTLFDLVGRNHGTLTNGPTWGGSDAAGLGSLTFDGSDDSVPLASSTGAMTAFTVAVRLKRTRTTAYEAAIGTQDADVIGWGGGGGGVSEGWARVFGEQYFPTLGGVRAVGDWQTLVVSGRQSAPVVATLNGVSTTVFTAGAFDTTSFTTIGARGGSSRYQGTIQSVWLWNGVNLSNSQAVAFCQEADAGYPTLIRRVSPVTWFVGTGGGGGGSFQAAWTAGSNVVIGGAF